ncbi:helix-turn-helix domain-containing protein [Hoylesella nanceiensis]|jgi:DNA-binding helix-turn-helix protein|uniref:helix-turn-helix domain-containing protein n=1 Tax=Hoylesella nanceiensis TaxID=425941 RepID=UPI0028D288D7|nr:helix-turn-helix domain-containing protein [Hoylesella nanceiensis]MDU2165458.1 helix-turn-helix domain-containing protein [Veillonella sp.]
MDFPKEIKRIRQRSFLTQQEFANALGVAFSTVNRWEAGRSKPNLKAMKSINTFCVDNNISYEVLEESWFDYKIEK